MLFPAKKSHGHALIFWLSSVARPEKALFSHARLFTRFFTFTPTNNWNYQKENAPSFIHKVKRDAFPLPLFQSFQTLCGERIVLKLLQLIEPARIIQELQHV